MQVTLINSKAADSPFAHFRLHVIKPLELFYQNIELLSYTLCDIKNELKTNLNKVITLTVQLLRFNYWVLTFDAEQVPSPRPSNQSNTEMK